MKAALEKLARGDKRTLASYVELVLEAHVEQSESGKPAGKRR